MIFAFERKIIRKYENKAGESLQNPARRVKFQGDGVANEKDCADLRVDFGGISAGMMLLRCRSRIGSGSTRAKSSGTTRIVLSAMLVFFGGPSYRENANGGRLTFARGFAVAILIAVPTTHVTALVVWRIRLSLP